MRKLLILVPALLLLVTGCAHYISDQSLSLVDRSVTFGKLREDPDAYRGKFVFLGGRIIKVTPVQEGTSLEVEQYDLDSQGMPELTSASGGRFLATTPEFLDTTTCRAGVPVTMVGEAAGKRVQPLKGVAYTYPVIAIREMHLFNTEENNFGTWVPYTP